MVLRITRGQIDAAHVDDVQRTVQEQLIPALVQLPGFQSYNGGINSTTGRLVAVSTWDSVEHATFPRDVINEIIRTLTDLGMVLEAPEIYDIVVQS